MKKAIITGITGQDGAYLAKLLLEKNYTVIGLTRNRSNLNKKNLAYLNIDKEVQIEECNLLDFSSIIKILDKYKPDELYNLAAQSSVNLSFDEPIGTITFNTISVLNLLESIRVLKLGTKFYQASSSEMYGLAQKLPIKEGMPFHPLSPYAISKASAYWTVVNYRESYNIFGVNGILFNHESYLRGPNYFIKKIIRSSLDIKHGLQKDLHIGNIDIKRDFGYAPDYVQAMWQSLQYHIADDYVICSGQSVCLRDIIYHVFDHFNIAKEKLIEDPALFRPTEINDMYGDSSKAKENLGWHYDKDFFSILDILISEEEDNYNEGN